MESLASKIDELSEYIANGASVDRERIADLLWAIYHEASDNAVDRVIARQNNCD
jgi:hypothetical protein